MVDDHTLVRKLLRNRLEAESDIKVVADVNNFEEAVQEILMHKPDILLTDIYMQGQLVFDAVKTIKAKLPDIRVIILTSFIQDQYIELALATEVEGYIVKKEAPESVIQAIHTVASGGIFYSADVQSRIAAYSRSARPSPSGQARISTLTKREKEALCYIARGLAKKDIAPLMKISIKTVEQHTTNLMAKLDIHDRVELARFAIREGLTEA